MKYMVICTVLAFANVSSAQNIDSKALSDLVAACKSTQSSGLSIWVDGKPFKDYKFDTLNAKIPSYSAHKSLISLAIGKLITDGKLRSIDTAVSAFYPEWKQGLKKMVTIRHLLNHTSGVEVVPTDPDGWNTPDVVQYALCASIVDTPGRVFNYNDKAVNLLRGIIQKLSGQRMDHYIAQAIFRELDITNYSWELDSAGNPENLLIAPGEFVKLGQLAMSRGKWKNRQLISAQWIDESLAPGQAYAPSCGLLWWRIPERITYVVDDQLLKDFKSAGVSEAFIVKFGRLKGRYDNVNIPTGKLAAVFGEDWKAVLDKELYPHFPRRATWEVSKNYIGYKAEGWLGQYIVIFPDKKIVACRMIRDSRANSTTEMRDFENYVYKLRK